MNTISNADSSSRPGAINAWPFDSSATFDIPGSDVRATIKPIKHSSIMAPDRIRAFISSGLIALYDSQTDAGGPSRPLTLSPVTWTDFSLTISVEDLTVRAPDGGGGRFRWEELRAVYQGVGANIKRIEYMECKIDIWRMETSGFPRREKRIKHLGTGTFQYAPDVPAGSGSARKNGTRMD